MQTYGKFRPTGFDPSGAFLPDRQNWLVLPCSRTRDSDCLAESNFTKCLELLGGESDTCEVHRFGHWGPGWFELIILHPDRLPEADEIEASLEDYAVLDDEDLSRRENDAYQESWQHGGAHDFKGELQRAFDLCDAVTDVLYDAESEPLMTFFESLIPSGEYYDSEGHPNVRYAVEKCTRADLARFLRSLRKQVA